MRRETTNRSKPSHPHAWLWEPLETETGFVLRSMFGAKAVYLDGLLVLCFMAKDEPWCGVLVCTTRENQASLLEEFPELVPHPVLSKWLYLSESTDAFERQAERLVLLAGRRDPRIGIVPPVKKRKSKP